MVARMSLPSAASDGEKAGIDLAGDPDGSHGSLADARRLPLLAWRSTALRTGSSGDCAAANDARRAAPSRRARSRRSAGVNDALLSDECSLA